MAAAAASLVLHLLLARGLALTSLGLDGLQPEAGAAPRQKRERRTDFTIRVPKSPAVRPAHERPLTIAAAMPNDERAVAERPSVAVATQRSSNEPSEHATASSATAPAPMRDTERPGAPALARAETATADGPAARAETPSEAARADGAAEPAALARNRAADAAVASRWRPREVVLLERLTAPTTTRGRTATGGVDEPNPTATPAARAAVDTAADAGRAEPADAPLGEVAEAVALTPAATPAPHPGSRSAIGPRGTDTPGDRLVPEVSGAVTTAANLAAARARRETPGSGAGAGRSPGRRSSASAEPASTMVATDGAGSGAAEPTSTVAAPGVGAARRGGGGGAVLTGPGRDSVGGAADGPAGAAVQPDARAVAGSGPRDRGDVGAPTAGTGSTAARTPGRARLAMAAAGGGSRDADPLAGDAAGVAAEPGIDAGPASGPRAVGRTADGTAERRPVTAAPGPGGAPEPTLGEHEAELSVASLEIGSVVDGRRHDDGPAAGPRPPDRVAVVVLPAESRVRDVAEAFARRGRDVRRRSDPLTTRADAVVDRGLQFLARAQRPDGRWSLGDFPGSGPGDVPQIDSDTAATGLALLAFLGAGHDHFDGPHRDTVRRGLEFLLSAQKPDGDLYLPSDELSNRCGWLYSHGIASIALCEAVGMTGDPLLRPAATRACGFIAAVREPELGGWRYVPRSDADLSVSGWMLIALRSGALARVDTDPQALAGVRHLLDAAATPGAPARFAYNPRKPDQRATSNSVLCMTAVGALMRLHTGAKPDEPQVAAAARLLAARRPAWDAGSRDCYLWYYASQVLVHTGGPEWDAWYATLVDTLATTQETSGAKAGSWDPRGPRPDVWGRAAGRIYVTALHLLALEVPDRRLPTYTAGE